MGVLYACIKLLIYSSLVWGKNGWTTRELQCHPLKHCIFVVHKNVGCFSKFNLQYQYTTSYLHDKTSCRSVASILKKNSDGRPGATDLQLQQSIPDNHFNSPPGPDIKNITKEGVGKSWIITLRRKDFLNSKYRHLTKTT